MDNGVVIRLLITIDFKFFAVLLLRFLLTLTHELNRTFCGLEIFFIVFCTDLA